MKGISISRLIATGLFGLVLQGAANAQIYGSEDTQGVPEFSDTPTQGAEVVDQPATNLATPPEEQPAAPGQTQSAPPQASPAGAGGGQEEGVDGDAYYGGDDVDNPREQRRIDEDRIDNALPGNPGPGVEPRPEGEEAGAVGEPREAHPAEGGRR